jgi:uncharacterized protein YbjT (DUF2867 family)
MSAVLVVGATGAQGGSVAAHLLRRGKRVRALTRDPGSARARALAATGAELVQGSLEEPDSLRRALQGCQAVFGVTNYWEQFDQELALGRNLIDAVAVSGVDRFVLSTLPSAHALSLGELEVPHFEMKAMLEEKARRLAGIATSFVHVAFYYENFLGWFAPREQQDGTFSLGFPQGEAPLAAVSVEDVGGVVAEMLERPDEFAGRTVGVVGDEQPVGGYAETLSRIAGKTVRYGHVPREVFASLGFPGARDLADMFDLNRRFILSRTADRDATRALHPEVMGFERWAARNRSRLLRALSRESAA